MNSNIKPQPMLLFKNEVAELLRVSERTIDRMDSDKSKNRKFPKPRKYASRKRWLVTEIEAYLTKGCNSS